MAADMYNMRITILKGTRNQETAFCLDRRNSYVSDGLHQHRQREIINARTGAYLDSPLRWRVFFCHSEGNAGMLLCQYRNCRIYLQDTIKSS